MSGECDKCGEHAVDCICLCHFYADNCDCKCSPWISIKDRLPQENLEVKTLHFRKDGLVELGYFGYHWDKNTATHWMPLPKPPQHN